MDALIRLTACQAVDLLRRREVSPGELLQAALERVADVDPALNALPTLCAGRARERLRDAAARAPLHGLPIVVKDVTPVAGVRTTFGSPIFADFVPARSDILVETLEARGALVFAKSNTSEFAAGANTFNEVFGPTVNPWDRRLTCGGSSGGSAVALATGMAWLATGNDLGGSLRIPASFCSVVGLRPSPGRVARGPEKDPFANLSVEGPLGRTVADVALMLDAQCGADPRDPISLPAPAKSFSGAVAAPVAPRRVAYSPDLGLTPVDPEVAAVCERAARRLADLGASVEEEAPDLSEAREVFQVLRAAGFATAMAPLLETHRAALKPEVAWNIDKGLALSAADIGRAQRLRGEMIARVAAFFRTYDLLVCPAVIVPPFPVGQRWVERIGETRFDTYVDWLAITFAITLTACPALSLPCGFTAAGLPVGLQMVGRPRGEAELLGAAALAEQAFGLAPLVPTDPRPISCASCWPRPPVS